MNPDRLAVLGTAVGIVVLTLATGPHVGLLTVPEGGFGAGETPGSGHADVTVVSVPDRGELAAGEYGDVHYLTVPDPTVRVSNVSGGPYVTLSVEVDGIWVSRTTVHTLRPGYAGPRNLSLGRAAIEEVSVQNETLDGHLRITLYDDRGSTTVHEEQIVVEVTR